ncbi:MAG TPA: hypothetical protein VFN10_16825 [Thermoanaerobaculia bacterium]|nr:hypothetical protein [Thermoanaerobaculia bacterium]
MNETVLPRILALILLVVSLAMLVPLGFAVASLMRGHPASHASWLIPLVFLGTGSALTVVLAKHPAGFRLYAAAFALWLVTAGYYFLTLIR